MPNKKKAKRSAPGGGKRKRGNRLGEGAVQICGWIDAETGEWAEKFCANEDRTLSWLVRDALREYREKREGKS